MTTKTILGAVMALAVVGGGGYWLGTRTAGGTGAAASDAASAGTPVAAGAASAAAGGGAAAPVRKILYYRNPMGLPDTSPVPKKDQMGMDYIPVYDSEETGDAAGTVKVSTEKVQKLGVRTEAAAMRSIERRVRASGRIEPDERRIAMISPKFEGYVERLHVNATGQPVAKGQPLFEAYSPEMVSAQREYAIAAQGVQQMAGAGGEALAGMKQLAESALARLRNWDLSNDEIAALVKTGEARRTVTLRSPAAGIVTEKKAFQGMRFMPGEALYQVTDLSSVWVVAEVFEQDIGLVRNGAKARVTLAAFPSQAFEGRITYVYPTLKAETRTVPVRIELANPQQLLKPAMFARVEVAVGASAPVLAVPESAVLDTGTRRVVLVQRGEGRFEPREVTLGARGDDYVEVLEGVKAGEPVVVAANFLIDAESNLKAALAGLTAAPAAGAASGAANAAAAGAKAGHQGQGSLDAIDAKGGVVTLTHEPIASLNWPAMTMEFKLANASLLAGVKPGARLSFEFVERAAGEWVITKVTPLGSAPTAAAASAGSNAHRGH